MVLFIVTAASAAVFYTVKSNKLWNDRQEREHIMQMAYKLDQTVRLIKSPVLLKTEDSQISYDSGNILAAASFEKRYSIDSISAENNQIVICVSENTGKAAGRTDGNVSLFDGCHISYGYDHAEKRKNQT